MNGATRCSRVDVAKDWIDVFALTTGRRRRVAATKADRADFAKAAEGAFVVFEASCGHERPLAQARVAFARVIPWQARDFARATGRLAKTDEVDSESRAGRAASGLARLSRTAATSQGLGRLLPDRIAPRPCRAGGSEPDAVDGAADSVLNRIRL